MAEDVSEATPRRRGRQAGSAVPTAGRGRRAGGGELVDVLNQTVSELIKENRQLKRQLDKLESAPRASANGTVERTLRTIQRKLERAVTTMAPPPRRRRSATNGATARRRRSTTSD
jgi:transcription elongation GreA/GreB family factor